MWATYRASVHFYLLLVNVRSVSPVKRRDDARGHVISRGVSNRLDPLEQSGRGGLRTQLLEEL